MAEDAKTGPKAVLDKLKELLDALGEVGGEVSEKDDKKPASEEIATAVAAQVKAVRDRYDGSVKWLVGAFVAIGVLLFGSLPFVNAVGIPLLERKSTPWLLIGLIVAAIGISLVVWARTRALEPQDASLGELAATFKSLGSGDKPTGSDAWWIPRKMANYELRDILNGDECAAHLGPGITPGEEPDAAVKQLIMEIAALESTVFLASADVSSREAVADHLGGQLDVLDKRMEVALKKTAPDPNGPPPAGSPTAVLASKWEELVHGYLCKLQDLYDGSVPDEIKRRSLAADRVRLDVYLGHRDLVLAESAIAQMRGTFRLTRRWLIAGGLLTLLGAAIYTAALPNDESEPSAVPLASGVETTGVSGLQLVKVTLPLGTPGVNSDCTGRPLVGALLSSVQPGGENGPFVVSITNVEGLNPNDPQNPRVCVGVLQVAKGEGSFERL